MDDLRKYWMWMSHACGQGSKTAVSILRHYEYPQYVYEASPEEIKKNVPKADNRILARLARKDLYEEEDILEWCDKTGVRVLTPQSEEYPKSLLRLSDAPMVLYALGDLPDFDNSFCCAVVGTRNMSDYGRKMAYTMGTGLADAGATLVSGLALGVDGMAMAGALEAGGSCIAVLGCGIDIVYPREHEALLKKVLETGAVITEYAPGVSPMGANFPVRNRIISGISQAVCVVEGSMSSGSLITARHALYQGRSLYAVPGNVGEVGSDGPLYLLKQGAGLARGAIDIVEDFEFIYPHVLHTDAFVPHISSEEAEYDYGVANRSRKKSRSGEKEKTEAEKEKTENTKKSRSAETPFPKKEEENGEGERETAKRYVDVSVLGENEKTVLDFMKDDVPMLADEIIKCGLSLSQVMVSLTMLEIAGAVEAGAGGYYLKRAADYGGDPEYITEDDSGL